MPKKSASRKKGKAGTKKKQEKFRVKEFADIPECQDPAHAHDEYQTSREEKMWDPNMDVKECFPEYSCLARVVLTYKQQHENTPSIEAIEKACSGVSQQYISDVLHESKYEPHEALKTIFVKDMPQHVIDKWKPEEMKLFTKGIMRHGKRFSIIRRKLLPHKRMEDFADFYYVWKRSSMAEDWRKARAIIKAKEKEMEEKRLRERTNRRSWSQPNNKLVLNLSNGRVMTRSATAAAIHSLQYGNEIGENSKSSTSISPSVKSEEISGEAGSTDSAMEHIQIHENELMQTATSEKSPMKNEQISDNHETNT